MTSIIVIHSQQENQQYKIYKQFTIKNDNNYNFIFITGTSSRRNNVGKAFGSSLFLSGDVK